MTAIKPRTRIPWQISRVAFARAICVLVVGFAVPVKAQTPYQTQSGEMILVESAGAARVVEKVRSLTQGMMVEIYVKPGDSVRKGQILGHAELDATKLQLDLARQTMESKANVDAAQSLAEAWTVTREETQEAVRKREADESRLSWAIAMEKMYQSKYEGELDAENTQRIQYEYWKLQYENRFFRAPVDGIVSEVLVEPGKSLNYGAHAFTVRNDNTFLLPVTVHSELASTAVPNEKLAVRSADGKSVGEALIDSVIDDPRGTGRKIVKLLVKAADLSAATRANLLGMKFDVLLPQVAQNTGR